MSRPFSLTIPCVTGVILSFSLLAGCGGGDKEVHVSGAATFDGDPIVYGIIQFIPDADKQHLGAGCMAVIEDGKYDTQSGGGPGITAGPYLARVTAHLGKPLPPPPDRHNRSDGSSPEWELVDESDLGGMGPQLFVGYELSVDLDGSVADFDVPAEASGYGIDGPPNSQKAVSNRR